MAMPADPTTARPAKDLAPRAAERGLVLGLVRKLIAIRFHRGNLWRLMQIIQARGECVWRQNLPLPELPDYARPVAAGLHPP